MILLNINNIPFPLSVQEFTTITKLAYGTGGHLLTKGSPRNFNIQVPSEEQ